MVLHGLEGTQPPSAYPTIEDIKAAKSADAFPW
jgi:hypothetical protein